MIKNKKKYTKLCENDKRRGLSGLSLKESVKRLEELLSMHSFFSSHKIKSSLPLSLSRQLFLKHKP